MSDSTIIAAIIVTTVVMFMWGRFPVMLVALAAGMSLYFTGLLTIEQTFAGFGDPVVLFIAGLFIVAAGLQATGITAWVGQMLSQVVGNSPFRLAVMTTLMVAVLSPLISMSGAVASITPVAILMALRLGHSPSKYLIPLAFASGAGSKLALTGTPKNVLIHEASLDAGYAGFGFFEFAYVGVPLLIGTVLLCAFLGRRLLPERTPESLPADFSRHAQTLVEQYGLTAETVRLRLREESPLIGRMREDIDMSAYGGLTLISATEGRTGQSLRRAPLAAGDLLIARGDGDSVAAFATDQGLALRDEGSGTIADTLFNRNSGLAEVVIPARSALVGQPMWPGMVTESGDLIVVGVQRNGEDIGPQPVKLQAGDHVLLQGSWQALDKRLADPEVLIVDAPDMVRRQAVPLTAGAWSMLAIVAAMVVVLATGLLPAAVGVLLAAMAVIALRILTVEESYRAIDWNTVVLVAAMMPLSTAMFQTGAADQLAELLVRIIGDGGPTALLLGIFVFTAILGQVISNTATALILIPIAIAAAKEFGVSPQGVLMSLNVGAAAAFLTPVATPPNLIVMGPGGYRFGDYWKLGLALMLLYFLVALFWVPLIWPLSPRI
jgi:di/tricarboxylate transporter